MKFAISNCVLLNPKKRPREWQHSKNDRINFVIIQCYPVNVMIRVGMKTQSHWWSCSWKMSFLCYGEVSSCYYHFPNHELGYLSVFCMPVICPVNLHLPFLSTSFFLSLNSCKVKYYLLRWHSVKRIMTSFISLFFL